jgi:RHS repeat-associated protein
MVRSTNNQLSSVAYDAAGNQEADGISHSFTYDAEGNVMAVDNGSTATYTYDALNHRVRTVTSAGTNEYLFDAQGRRTSTWLPSASYGTEGRVYWGNKQIAFRAQNGQTFYEHQSYLGTERLRTNYQGAVAATESSLVFGDDLNQTVPIPYANQDNGQYAGQEHDTESGSEHAQFRQYSSTEGRWMSPDPYMGSYKMRNPQSFNRYSYAKNRPLSAVDPSGQEAGDPCDTIVCFVDDPDGITEPADGGVIGGEDVDPGNLSVDSDPVPSPGDPDPTQDTLPMSPKTPDNTVELDGYQCDSCIAESPESTAGILDDLSGFEQAPNNLPTPTRFKLTIPGTNYCGPGGNGTPTDRVDAACAAHDACYGNAWVSFLNNIGLPKTAQQTAAIQGCDAALSGALRNISYPTSNEYGEATIVSTFFNLPSGYSLR